MTTRGWVLFGAMCLIWGVPYLLIKVAVEDVSPSMLVLARTGIAGLLLLPIAALRNELRPLAPHWRALVAFAAIEIALPWVLLGAAETRIGMNRLDRRPRQYIVDGHPIAQGNLLEPVHEIAQMIFADFEANGDMRKQFTIRRQPAKPAFERLLPEAFAFGIVADCARAHPDRLSSCIMSRTLCILPTTSKSMSASTPSNFSA